MHFNHCLTEKIRHTSTVKVLNIHKCSHIKGRTRVCLSSVIGVNSRENIPILRNQSKFGTTVRQLHDAESKSSPACFNTVRSWKSW